MPFLTRPGLPALAYDFDRGDARPDVCVVFLHGFASVRGGEKAAVFRERARRGGWSFLAFDARGHGESGGGMRDFTFGGFLDDLDAMRDGPLAATERLVFVGSSLGGAAALFAACRRPARVAAVVALAPGIDFVRRFLDVLPPAERENWRTRGARHVKNSWIDVELGWEFVADAARHPPAAALAPEAPTLLVHGAADEVVPVEVSRRYSREFRGKTLDFREIPDGDHRLSAHRETVADWVDAWIAAHALAPRPRAS